MDDQKNLSNEAKNHDSPSGKVVKDSSSDAAPSLETQAERLIGDLEYGCAANFTEYRGAALAIARAYLRTAPPSNGWFDVMKQEPPIRRFVPGHGDVPKNLPYVLTVDVKGRMSVGYASAHTGYQRGYHWTFAKPIGEPTHWMPLPSIPSTQVASE